MASRSLALLALVLLALPVGLATEPDLPPATKPDVASCSPNWDSLVVRLECRAGWYRVYGDSYGSLQRDTAEDVVLVLDDAQEYSIWAARHAAQSIRIYYPMAPVSIATHFVVVMDFGLEGTVIGVEATDVTFDKLTRVYTVRYCWYDSRAEGLSFPLDAVAVVRRGPDPPVVAFERFEGDHECGRGL